MLWFGQESLPVFRRCEQRFQARRSITLPIVDILRVCSLMWKRWLHIIRDMCPISALQHNSDSWRSRFPMFACFDDTTWSKVHLSLFIIFLCHACIDTITLVPSLRLLNKQSKEIKGMSWLVSPYLHGWRHCGWKIEEGCQGAGYDVEWELAHWFSSCCSFPAMGRPGIKPEFRGMMEARIPPPRSSLIVDFSHPARLLPFWNACDPALVVLLAK